MRCYLATVGGVRFIKWAQYSLVSFVKCDPPSILLCGGDKRYNAFKDVLAPICFSIVVNLEWHLRQRVMWCWRTQQASLQKVVWPWRERAFFTSKDKNKRVGDRLHPSCEVFGYLVLRGKLHLTPQFANLNSSSMGATDPWITSIDDVLDFPVKRMSKGSKIHSSSTHKGLTWSWSTHLQRLIVCWFGMHCF